MKHQWYCGVEGQQYGPYTWEQMRAMAEEGRLIAESYVRRSVDQQWMTAAQIPGLLKKKTKTPVPTPAPPAAPTTASKRVAKQSPAAPPPVISEPAPLPVGKAIVPEPPAAPPVSFTATLATPASHAPTAADEEGVVGKKKKPLLLVGILAGVVLLVGVIGAGLLVWNSLSQSSGSEQEAKATPRTAEPIAAAQAPAAEKNPVEINPLPAEANPITPAAAESEGGPPAPAATSIAAAPPQPTIRPADAAAASKVLKSVTTWTDAARGSIKLAEISLKVHGAWLAADESGTRVEPDGGSAKYVFVEVRLTNTSQAPRAYKSWNTSAGASAVLADAAGQPLAFVPASATPAASRLGAVEISPGQTVTDRLVFQAPAGSVEKLRLALAKSALAGNAKTRGSHFAFEITRESLLRGGSTAQPANDPLVTPGDGPQPAGQPPVTDRNVVPPSATESLQPLAPAAPNAPPPAPAATTEAQPPPKFDPKVFDKELQKENAPPPADKAGAAPAPKGK